MQINLTFHPPTDTKIVGIGYQLDETESGLIPNVGDMVRFAGAKRRIIAKSFTFHPGKKIVDVDFATEDLPKTK